MPADHGLTPAQLSRLKEILAPFAEHLDRVVLFGSRASGAYRPSSDIDLALYGPIDEKKVDRLHTLFMESSLPVRVDVVSYQALQSATLKQHIDQAGVTLFDKDALMSGRLYLPLSRDEASSDFSQVIDAGHGIIPLKNGNTVMDSPQLQTTLGSVCSKIGSGATPRGGKEVYSTSGVAFIRSQNVLDFSFLREGLVFINDEQSQKLENVKVQPHDVLINITGDSVARTCMVPSELLPARVNQHVAIVRAIRDKIDPKYILYTLQNCKQHLLSIASTGGTRNALTKSMLDNLSIKLPIIEMQKTIAATLSCLDDKIELNNKINANLEAQAQAIFKSWFVDFEPFGEKMSEDWRKGTLENICSYSNNRISVSDLTLDTYISTENMSANKGGSIRATSLPSMPQTTAYLPGDTLISNIRPYFKKIVYSNSPGGCSPDVLCFCPNKANLSLYLYHVLYRDSFFDYMVAGSKGTKMPRGDKQQIMNYNIIIPSDDALNEFASIVTPMNAKRLLLNKESAHLSSIRDTLLPGLMSGEIPVDLEESK